MSISYYKLNLSDISKNIKNMYKITYPSVQGYNRIKNSMHFYLLQEEYMYLIIILIYLTLFFKELNYKGSNVYDLILKQSEEKPKIFISSSDGAFDFTKKGDIYTELPDKNKFVQIGNHTFFEMRWFSRYLLHSKMDYTEVHVFILTDDSIPIKPCNSISTVSTLNKTISIRKGYKFIGYKNDVANAFIFRKSMLESKSIIPIGCFRIYKKEKGFKDDQSIDITTIQTVSKDVLANTKEYRAYMYNRKLFNYNPRFVRESEYKREWRENKNVDACEKCGVKFSFFTRRHHCRYCGSIICSKCYSLYPLESWFEKNGKIHNITTDSGGLKKRIFCNLCSKTKKEEIDKQKEKIAEQQAEQNRIWKQGLNQSTATAGGKKKNKYIKKKENVKKVGVYRSKGGYYYRRYKNGKKKRISKEMYHKLKKSL